MHQNNDYNNVKMIIRTQKNILTAYGTIWEGDGRYFLEEFARLERDYSEITIHLHTPGGSVFDGNLIYNALNKSASSIHIVIDGIAASMGAIIILSAQKVSIVENGYIMLHAPASYSNGDADSFEKQAKLLRSIEKNFVEKLSARTGKSAKEVEKWLVGDNWFDAKEAKRLGFVTDIISAQTATLLPIEDVNAMREQDVYNMYAGLFASLKTVNILDKNMKSVLIQSLVQALSLSGITEESSETAVIQAIQERITNEKEAREKAEKALNTFKQAQITTVVEGAVKSGKITEAQKAVYEKIAETSGVEALITVLENTAVAGGKKATQAPNISSLLQSSGSNTGARASWDFDQWQKEDPKGLERLSVDQPERFKELFNAKYKK